MSEIIDAISNAIEEWGYVTWERWYIRVINPHIPTFGARDLFVRVVSEILIVTCFKAHRFPQRPPLLQSEPSDSEVVLLMVHLGSPDSIDRLKEVIKKHCVAR